MPLIYYDLSLERNLRSDHPAFMLDKEHPCYRMVREMIDGKSVMHWNKTQSIKMYSRYVDGWVNGDIVTEFDDKVYGTDWKDIIQQSYYVVSVTAKGKVTISEETIEDLWAAYKMEKEIMEANGEE